MGFSAAVATVASELMVRFGFYGVTSCGGFSRNEQRYARHSPPKQWQHLPWACQDFFEGSPGNTTTSRISLGSADSRGNPVRVIVDWGCVMVTPLMHQHTCQCLLDDLMPLENNLYGQTRRNRLGEDSKRQ
ncbi:syntaxin binding protein [Trypanosoma cruzi]|nr:syntaxin binding protein [Trypanosoma cruzi]